MQLHWVLLTISILALAVIVLAVALATTRIQYQKKIDELTSDNHGSKIGVGELASFVSHDLRNPLSVVMAYANLLARMSKINSFDTRTQKQIDGIGRAADRMDFMIQNLVDVTKIETGRFSLEASPEDFNSALTEALDSVHALVAEKSLKLSVEILDTDLPLMEMDRRRMVHGIRSVLHNAVKFTPNGKSVRVVSRLVDGQIELTISDEGPGIPAQLAEHVFECSWRNRGQPKTHTGLSLFVTKSILEAHGGSVTFESQPNQGAVFRLTLPLRAVRPTVSAETAAPSLGARSKSSRG